MEHMSNIFSTSFGINFAKLTRVWLALIWLTAKINSLLFLSHPVYSAFPLMFPWEIKFDWLRQLRSDRVFSETVEIKHMSQLNTSLTGNHGLSICADVSELKWHWTVKTHMLLPVTKKYCLRAYRSAHVHLQKSHVIV